MFHPRSDRMKKRVPIDRTDVSCRCRKAELRIDISRHRSDPVSEFGGQQFDPVVTVCDSAKDACPDFPGAKRLARWLFRDPADATDDENGGIAVFRQVWDQLRTRVQKFLETDAI